MRSRSDKKIFNARVCFWNINGRTHFLQTDPVIAWVQTNFDIIFVTETHFIKGTRFSVPCFTPYHNPLSGHTDRKPHGGISCFIRTSILHHITDVDKKTPETIVVHFIGGHRLFSNYIVPNSSPYFADGVFSRVANQFSHKNSDSVIVGGGDLNARVGDIKQKLPLYCSYRQNVDEFVNDSGRTVRSICESYNCFVINNMNIGEVACDGDYTFEKGGRTSQNDILISNQSGLLKIKRFHIHQIGWNPSDHTPISVNVDLDVTDHNLVVAASQDILYDPSSDLIRKPKKIRQEQIDWESYKTLAEQDYQHYDDVVQQLRGDFKLKDMDTCVNKLTDSLYNIANTLIPQNTDNNTHTAIAIDPLMELADQVHTKWRRGECESSERDTIRNEVVDHLKTSAISKERTAWANVLREKDSKAVWDLRSIGRENLTKALFQANPRYLILRTTSCKKGNQLRILLCCVTSLETPTFPSWITRYL